MSRKKKKLPTKGFILGFILVAGVITALLSTGTVKVLIDASSVAAQTPANYSVYGKDTNLAKADTKNVLFFTSSWCGSCDRISNILKSNALKFNNISFYEVNIEDNRDLSNTYKAYLTPAIVLLGNDKPIVYQEVLSNDVDKIVSKFASE